MTSKVFGPFSFGRPFSFSQNDYSAARFTLICTRLYIYLPKCDCWLSDVIQCNNCHRQSAVLKTRRFEGNENWQIDSHQTNALDVDWLFKKLLFLFSFCSKLYAHEFSVGFAQPRLWAIYVSIIRWHHLPNNDYIIMTIRLLLHWWWLDDDYKTIKLLWNVNHQSSCV